MAVLTQGHIYVCLSDCVVLTQGHIYVCPSDCAGLDITIWFTCLSGTWFWKLCALQKIMCSCLNVVPCCADSGPHLCLLKWLCWAAGSCHMFVYLSGYTESGPHCCLLQLCWFRATCFSASVVVLIQDHLSVPLVALTQRDMYVCPSNCVHLGPHVLLSVCLGGCVDSWPHVCLLQLCWLVATCRVFASPKFLPTDSDLCSSRIRRTDRNRRKKVIVYIIYI